VYRTYRFSIWPSELGRIGEVCSPAICYEDLTIVALSGSKHVEFLLDNHLINLVQSGILQKVYSIKELPQEQTKSIKESLKGVQNLEEREKIFDTAIQAGQPDPGKEKQSNESVSSDTLLASKGTGKLVSLCFDVPQIDVEMERALVQVKEAIAKERDQTGGVGADNPDEKK
jgi:hypothetical protein